MEIRKAMMFLMKVNGMSNAQLAKRLGVSNSVIWERLNNKNAKSPKVDTTVQMLRAMDYKLVAVPSDKALPKGSVEIE